MQRNYSKNEYYIIWIRNPIKRFVSAFYYVKNIVSTKIKDFKHLIKSNKLNLDNCIAPNKIINKYLRGYCYSKKYDYLVNCFKTANDLAESLTIKNLIKDLMLEDYFIQKKNIFLKV